MGTHDRYKTVLLFGAPGIGKGTQGKILGAMPGFYHNACGDMFRQVDPHSELGKIFFQYSSKGELVPDDITVKMWHQAMAAHVVLSNYRPNSDLLILDGIPRTPKQAQLMEQHIEVLRVVHLTCKEPQVMFERLRRRALKENRTDDADEKVIRRRWDVYEKETHPVLAHYPDKLIAEVDAVGSPAEVLKDTLQIIAPVQAKHFGAFEG